MKGARRATYAGNLPAPARTMLGGRRVKLDAAAAVIGEDHARMA